MCLQTRFMFRVEALELPHRFSKDYNLLQDAKILLPLFRRKFKPGFKLVEIFAVSLVRLVEITRIHLAVKCPIPLVSSVLCKVSYTFTWFVPNVSLISFTCR